LAEEIQRLSSNAREQTTNVLEKLQSVIADNSLSVKNGKTHDSMANTLEHMLGSLNKVNKEFGLLLQQIIENGQTLGTEIGKLTEKIVFHEEMAGMIDDVANGLNELAALIREQFPDSAIHENADNLESLASFYTTEGERNVHMAVTGVAVHKGADANMPEIKKDEKDDMGDNIELF